MTTDEIVAVVIYGMVTFVPFVWLLVGNLITDYHEIKYK